MLCDDKFLNQVLPRSEMPTKWTCPAWWWLNGQMDMWSWHSHLDSLEIYIARAKHACGNGWHVRQWAFGFQNQAYFQWVQGPPLGQSFPKAHDAIEVGPQHTHHFETHGQRRSLVLALSDQQSHMDLTFNWVLVFSLVVCQVVVKY